MSKHTKELFTEKIHTLSKRKMFWRIFLFYFIGVLLLFSIFSVAITSKLTDRSIQDQIERSHDILSQSYSSAEYILNNIYTKYYALFQSWECSRLISENAETPEDILQINQLLTESFDSRSGVESVYLVNSKADRVYTSDGIISTCDDFSDQEALDLLSRHNESSSAIFLPRVLPAKGQESEPLYFITLVFSRHNQDPQSYGGLIVNINEPRFIQHLVNDVENDDTIYIISEDGNILANTNVSLLNTSISDTDLWQNCVGHNEISFQTNFNGENSLVTAIKSPRLSFYFLQITPVAHIYNKVYYIRNLILLYFLILLIIALVITAFGSHLIYRPLSDLISNLKSLGHTEHSSPKEEHPQDELSFLEQTYQEMFEKISVLSKENRRASSFRKKEFITGLLNGQINESTLASDTARYLNGMPFSSYLAFTVEFPALRQMQQTMPPQDICNCQFIIINLLEDLFTEQTLCLGIEQDNWTVAGILCIQDQEPSLHDQITAAFDKVCMILKEHIGYGIASGIGTPVRELKDLGTSYNYAKTAQQYQLILGPESVIFYEDISSRQYAAPAYPMEIDNDLLQSLKNRNAAQAEHQLELFFDYYKNAAVDAVNTAIIQLTLSINRSVNGMLHGREQIGRAHV